MIDDRPSWTITLSVYYPENATTAGNGASTTNGNGSHHPPKADRFATRTGNFKCFQALTAFHQMGVRYSKAINGLPQDSVIEMSARRWLE